jgi:hypothetical protein
VEEEEAEEEELIIVSRAVTSGVSYPKHSNISIFLPRRYCQSSLRP